MEIPKNGVSILRSDHYSDEEYYNELISDLKENWGKPVGSIRVNIHTNKVVEMKFKDFLEELNLGYLLKEE